LHRRKLHEGASLTHQSAPNSLDSKVGALIWQQEFDVPAGEAPSMEFWGYENGDGSQFGLTGWGNTELQSYQPENTKTDGNSHLVITAQKTNEIDAPAVYYGPAQYTSGRIVTKDKLHFQYGRYEIRAKVSEGVGLWPAFWMLGANINEQTWPDCGEIDIMEFIGRRPNTIYGTLHGPGYFGDDGHGITIDLPEPVFLDYHTFTVDWLPDLIVWYLDGNEYFRASAETVAPNKWVFNNPFYFLLNMAVGGHLGGEVKDLADTTELLVDYIRVYEIDGFGRAFKP
jgi:beta-glucanase (GH16 family)